MTLCFILLHFVLGSCVSCKSLIVGRLNKEKIKPKSGLIEIFFISQLSYFATIKGQCVHFGRDGLEERQHSKETVEQMVENLVADLGLLSDADKEAKTLSKPASRKLSLAIALIGDPQVSLFFVFLDFVLMTTVIS